MCTLVYTVRVNMCMVVLEAPAATNVNVKCLAIRLWCIGYTVAAGVGEENERKDE